MPVRALLLSAVCVLLLAACGGKKFGDAALAADIKARLGTSSTIICWTKSGTLGGAFHHSYNHVCGLHVGFGSVYVDVGAKQQWCVVTPRSQKLPLCPGFG